MRKNSRAINRTAVFFSAFIPFMCFILYVFRNHICLLTGHIPRCPFNAVTGYLCPACGNTRCLISLLHGDIICAIGYNAIPVLLLIIGLTFYAELVSTAFNHHVRIFPRSFKLSICLIIFAAGYCVLRNVFPLLSFSIKNY